MVQNALLEPALSFLQSQFSVSRRNDPENSRSFIEFGQQRLNGSLGRSVLFLATHIPAAIDCAPVPIVDVWVRGHRGGVAHQRQRGITATRQVVVCTGKVPGFHVVWIEIARFLKHSVAGVRDRVLLPPSNSFHR